jgi:heme/copper-type cytochrome/quinol oxidase subunit 3
LPIWITNEAIRLIGSSRVALIGTIGPILTIGLGAVFLFGQGREYAQLLREHVTISSNLFGTTFFTLTGFHGLHVLIGLVALAILLGLALAGDFKDPEAPGVGAVGLYWHFVDAVWIVIFTIVYLGTVL